MELKTLPYDLTVCKLPPAAEPELSGEIFFLAKTPDELSLVCPEENVPAGTTVREDGWKGFCIPGELDLSLIGVLAGITAVLAREEISVFALSTFNTDYILVKKENYDRARDALIRSGYKLT